jgi:hypothetical protein
MNHLMFYTFSALPERYPGIAWPGAPGFLETARKLTEI